MANRYSARFKLREDVFGSITPNHRVQPNIVAPHGKGDWKPARWLPVVWEATNLTAGTDAYVISSGKVVALDAEDRLVPAGLRSALVGTTTGTVVLTYTSTDVAWGVHDITTGKPLTAPKTVTTLELAQALVDRGFVDRATAPSNTTHCKEIIEAFISLPVGIAAYDIHVYAGQAQDGDQTFTNYNKQHAVQFLTELEISVPYMAGDSVASDPFDASSIVVASSATSGQRPTDGTVLDATGAADLGRWDPDDIGSVVVLVLSERDIAANTSRTPIACDVDGVLVSEKPSIDLVKKEGDFYLDAKAGYLVLHADTYATLVAGGTTATFTYYHYSDGALASSERFIYFTGIPKYGDRRVSVDAASNFCPKGSTADILPSTAPHLGMLLCFDQEPKNLLQYVKSGFANIEGLSAASKMPGTATGGFSDKITLAEEKVSNSLVVITVRI